MSDYDDLLAAWRNSRSYALKLEGELAEVTRERDGWRQRAWEYSGSACIAETLEHERDIYMAERDEAKAGWSRCLNEWAKTEDDVTRERDELKNALYEMAIGKAKMTDERDEALSKLRQSECEYISAVGQIQTALEERDEARRAFEKEAVDAWNWAQRCEEARGVARELWQHRDGPCEEFCPHSPVVLLRTYPWLEDNVK